MHRVDQASRPRASPTAALPRESVILREAEALSGRPSPLPKSRGGAGTYRAENLSETQGTPTSISPPSPQILPPPFSRRKNDSFHGIDSGARIAPLFRQPNCSDPASYLHCAPFSLLIFRSDRCKSSRVPSSIKDSSSPLSNSTACGATSLNEKIARKYSTTGGAA